MDLLCKVYSNSSDDEELPKRQKLTPSPQMNPKPKLFQTHNFSSTNQTPQLQKQAFVSGRYVSKRERALLGSAPSAPDPEPVSSSFALTGSISDASLPHDMLSLLRRQRMCYPSVGQIPERQSVTLNCHTKAVNAIHWSPTHAHLLASAGMDHMVYIWNVWSKDQKKACVLNFHNAAVKDVKWSQQGSFVLSCGYDCKSRLVDVEKGMESQVFDEDQIVRVIKFHPDNVNLFLSGGSKGCVRLWDVRSGKVVQNYTRGVDSILDVEFMLSGRQFVSSSDICGSNISENAIVVWDVLRQIPLSNQVYVEAYTCPSVRCHPFDPVFVAQSNGNYVAIFSTSLPFKLNKYKRYEGHGIFGFPVKCNFSLDGENLASGSSDGSIYFYNYQSSKLVRKINMFEQACIDVAFHPTIPNVIASCSWDGGVSVFE